MSKRRLKILCKEAVIICDKCQYKESSLFERIKLSIHLYTCKSCKEYSRQNKIMTRCLSTHEKETITENFTNEEKKGLKKTIESNS